MGKERAERFNELIKKELGEIILNFLDTKPGILVTITRIFTNANLFASKVYISVYPPDSAEETLEKLNFSIYKIQQLLNKRLNIRPVPKIFFQYDKNPEEASEIEKLIEKIKNEE